MRKEIAAANWKMNHTYAQAEALLDDLRQQKHHISPQRIVVIGVPYLYLKLAQDMLHHLDHFHVAAQNMHHEESGAFTGEISAPMLKSVGVEYVILGHSERRENCGETNENLAKKVSLALEYEIKPIFCCGEPLSVREAGKEKEWVHMQLNESLFHITPSQMHNFVIAYEPVWAIGTGQTATKGQAQDMHSWIRGLVAEKYGREIADSVSILYGGSVKASNAKSIFHQPDVDGGLVGGASLIAADFATIIDSLKREAVVV
ncbi:MAG TPA: triose-phosphate isomerase [Phnomibacter sp.]|nr:triose-phosphate isomerase [Phnomibacter sp.]